MITAIYSLSYVGGAELWLLFWFLCAMAYTGICVMLKPNRGRKAIRTVVMGLVVAEAIIDIVWAVIYYHNGTYLNYGIGAIYGLTLWIPVLVIAMIVVTIINRKNIDR